jgi:hypothetical protein
MHAAHRHHLTSADMTRTNHITQNIFSSAVLPRQGTALAAECALGMREGAGQRRRQTDLIFVGTRLLHPEKQTLGRPLEFEHEHASVLGVAARLLHVFVLGISRENDAVILPNITHDDRDSWREKAYHPSQ